MKKMYLKYILWIVFLCCYIFFGNLLIYTFRNYVRESITVTFQQPEPWIYYVDLLFYGFFGILLGLEYFLKERAKAGKWKINRSKLFIIGLPSFICFSIVPIITIFKLPVDIFMFVATDLHGILFKILFGYILITSFYKE